MATKQIVFTQDEINTLSPSGLNITDIMYAVSVVASNTGSEDEVTNARNTLLAHRNDIADIWQKYKLLDKLLKTFKNAMELTISTFTDEEGNIHGFEKQFKWQAGAKTTNCVAMGELLRIAQGNGVTLEEMGNYIKPINAKNAAKMLGMSDEAFINQFGNLTKTKINKPTLKGV